MFLYFFSCNCSESDSCFFFDRPSAKKVSFSMETDEGSEYEPEDSSESEEEPEPEEDEYDPEDESSADEEDSEQDTDEDEEPDHQEETKSTKKDKKDKNSEDKPSSEDKSSSEDKPSSQRLSPFEVAEFQKLIIDPPTCVTCNKKLAVHKGRESYIPKALRIRLKEMTSRNNFCDANFYTKDKSSDFYCKPVNCSNCIQVAKEELVERLKVAEVKCKDCGVKLFFKEDKLLAKNLSNPTIREKRGYARVKMSMVKKDKIFVNWQMDPKCSGGCQDKSKLRRAAIPGQPGSGAGLLANFQAHGMAMNQASTQHLDVYERKYVQETVSQQAFRNICAAMDVDVPEEQGPLMYEDLIKNKSLVPQPFDYQEKDNYKNITNKIHNFLTGGQVNDKQVQMMSLIKFILTKYPQELKVDRREFADYAKRQGWWVQDQDGNFSDNFTITKFSGYNKSHAYIHLVDVDLSQPDRPWHINTRVWGRLYKYLMNTRVDGDSYLSRIQSLQPRSWTQDAPETPTLSLCKTHSVGLTFMEDSILPPSTPRDDEELKSGLSAKEAAEVARVLDPNNKSGYAKFIRLIKSQFGLNSKSRADFKILCESEEVGIGWFPEKFSVVTTYSNSTYCPVFPFLIAVDSGHFQLNPKFCM